MKWRNVKLVFFREVRDQLRDRRTLFLVAVLPLLLYPILGLGTMYMATSMTEHTANVVILGAEYLPADPKLIDDKGQFVSDYFDAESDAQRQSDARKLRVITDHPAANSQDESDKGQRKLVEEAREVLALLKQYRNDANESSDLEVREAVSRRMAQSKLQLVIVIPKDFAKNIAKANQQFSQHFEHGKRTEKTAVKYGVILNTADEKSKLAHRRLGKVLDKWRNELSRQRFDAANLPADFSEPAEESTIDVAVESAISANMLSKLIPALLIIMTVTGAFYPAVDLAAGEKERGTMETLLISPATRGEIVVGKFLTVFGFSTSTALLNLLTIVLTGGYMGSLGGGKIGNIAPPSPGGMLWVLILLIPVAALFSALCLSLATFARSSKEGQYYLTPLLMVTMGLTMFCISPSVEMTPFFSVLPVIAPALLLKEVLSPTSTTSMWYAVPVLVTSVGYSLLALWWAIEQFSREEVLFRESERFEVKLWLKQALRDKKRFPSFTQAGFLFLIILLLQFGTMKTMQNAISSAETGHEGATMMRLLVVQQLALIATPALLMGLMLTSSMKDTFRLRLPNWRFVAAAAALAFVLHPLSLELGALMHTWKVFPDLPPELADRLATMTSDSMPLVVVLLVFAVAPGVCEEVAYRGFILSGFGQSKRVWLAIVLSALTFGFMHMIPQQVFNAALLGLVLGLIAFRSNSLLPGILFHVIYNSITVISGRYGDPKSSLIDDSPLKWFVYAKDGAIRYEWTTLAIAAILAVVMLRWVARNGLVERREFPRDTAALSQPQDGIEKSPMQAS